MSKIKEMIGESLYIEKNRYTCNCRPGGLQELSEHFKEEKNSTSCSESNMISFSQSNYNIIDKDLPYIKPPKINVI